VDDRRSGRGASRARLADWLEGEDGRLPAGASPEAEESAAPRCDPISNFVAKVRVTSRPGGFISRAGVGRKGAQEYFRCAGGLGMLFLGGGKTVHLPNRLSLFHPRVCSESAAGAAPMADWRRGGRGRWTGDERVEGGRPDGRRLWPRPGAPTRGLGPPGRVPVDGGGGAWGPAVAADPRRGGAGGGAVAMAGCGRGSFYGRAAEVVALVPCRVLAVVTRWRRWCRFSSKSVMGRMW
jgi:hypothetical protein